MTKAKPVTVVTDTENDIEEKNLPEGNTNLVTNEVIKAIS